MPALAPQPSLVAGPTFLLSHGRWVQSMRPAAALLKFVLPYNHDKHPSVRYLDGDLFLPVWGPRTTSETRLLVTEPDKVRSGSWPRRSKSM
jgi:hypothetical protein